jgi:hypothetical protein
MERASYALSMLVITLQNVGNSAMIFGTPDLGAWAIWKVRLLEAAPLLLLALAAIRKWLAPKRPETAPCADGLMASWHVALLPLAFVMVSMAFGNRLWSHHFSSMIPLAYLVLFVAVHQLQGRMRLAPPRWIGFVLISGLIVGNLQQQQVFFERLTATGGIGLFSNALNRMSEDALAMSPELVHVFPEWGFGMPFALLTGNRRTYEVDMSAANLQRLADAGATLRVYYWKPETESSYRDTLAAQGFRISNSGVYLQRDQQPAFYWLEGAAPGSVE